MGGGEWKFSVHVFIETLLSNYDQLQFCGCAPPKTNFWGTVSSPVFTRRSSSLNLIFLGLTSFSTAFLDLRVCFLFSDEDAIFSVALLAATGSEPLNLRLNAWNVRRIKTVEFMVIEIFLSVNSPALAQFKLLFVA